MNYLNNNTCFCGNQKKYEDCCEPLLSGDKIAETPEQLMRSRYTAYVQKNAIYVYQTYASEKQAENPVNEIKEFATSCRFVSLSVIETDSDENKGFVEFKATYFYQNLYCVLHERSQFIKEQNQWRYLDGIIFPVADIKVGRNDDCPCGSAKKYKKCHGA